VITIFCKFLVAVGIVSLLLVLIEKFSFSNEAKGTIGMSIGWLSIIIDIFLAKKASPRVQRFFSLLPENSTTYCRHKKTANKQTNRCRPTPPIPYKEANQYHQSTYEAEHTSKHPLKDASNKIYDCIHGFLLYRSLAGLYRLVRRLSTKMQKNRGVQRGLTPLPGVWGCPPNPKSPKIGGFRGLKEH